jgi:RNA polymerase sigma-70 factor (ECF subfamily)
MSGDTTRESLLSRVRDAEDQGAWREFDERYRDLILRYARARGLQEADAEDVRQVVMMGLARSLRSFRYRPELGRFRDYLRRSVRNALVRTVSCPRSERQALWEGEFDALPDRDDAGRDEIWEREWMHDHYRQALRRARVSLEQQSYEIFLALASGGAVAEVATSFGVSADVVYKTKQRVRERLRELIDEQLRHEEFPERLR